MLAVETIILANQSKIKSEEINDELSKFWATRLYDEMSSYESSFKSENLDNEAEVDDDELQRVGTTFFNDLFYMLK